MDLIGIAENTVKIILILGLPSLIVSMIIGLVISIFSAVTQVNDASLSFVPKMIFVSAFILITLPWVGEHLETFTKDLWDIILTFGH
ncbi:flagellar biosynthetic protein FliQ [Aliarcobacter butzleri]|jgi:flagellar biosynthetic protein FliQ|uniref:flagellar biosynthetic protein FliQ n=1 Tax=Arcobacteraceae TaxID=2808963 RepID=UPI0021BAF562|nr:flagellar biosynthetic protein FliQ [Arcobacter lacus]MCT7907946.1 flagellar biosynthetic protein FliQ [Arcobacter lacus]MCT7911519.1 flagellar biosynthetic protein FliQ [Arcobacter lacus]